MKFVIKRISYTEDALKNKILENLIFMKKDYPEFYKWYKTKVLPELAGDCRQIYLATNTENGEIAGVLILKDCSFEKKICTLCVFEKYRYQGLGSRFVELAMNVLNTKTPMITVSENHKAEFENLFAKYGFEFSMEYPNYYKESVSEYSYNGFLDVEKMKKSYAV